MDLFLWAKNIYFGIFHLTKKKFFNCLFYDFLQIRDINYNEYEIKNINSDRIILNNFVQKKIYIIINDIYYLIKNKYNYFLNILVNDKYLLFDTIKDNNLQFTFIDLLNYASVKNHELTQLLNNKIDNNYPRFLTINNKNKIIALYENNQICQMNLILSEKEKENQDNKPLKNKKQIKIIYNSKKDLIPNEYYYSEIYSNEYHPGNLFKENSDYYCSRKGVEHFIEFDFSQEYYFLDFKMVFRRKFKECIPKLFSIIIYDNKKRMVNELLYVTENNEIEVQKSINEIGRYIRFNFIENFGGDYIIIKNIYFRTPLIDNIKYV